ncbi:unnamed protein product [Caenorhabditis auriculariae]|uniref:Uncharacterized protein n=1 Tax=Caenorhabditis auriculariae TaxID=2777116 RepID=A0A8S1HBH4_9PELO|nr:unnamed protein product [Caenorhabditis auriculariae]
MCVLWLGPIPIVMLYSPQLVEVILTSNKHLDKGFAYKLLEPWLGPGLLTREPVEVLSLITLCTLDVICETSMGKSVNAQLEEKVIDDRHRELEQSGWKFEGRLAFLDLLLEMARNGQMDRADIQAEVDTFMFEGHDTTSAGLMWALHLIGTYPEVQQKIHDELDEVLGEDDDVTVEHLPRLKYMECCLKESLRVCPSVPIVMRELATDQQLGGVTVPKGVHVLINHHLVHRDPSQWPDPERFDPDRFLPENAAKRHTYSFIPFSAGSRNCIGQRFAILEEKVILAHILRRFRIVAVEARHEVRYKVEIIMRPINGIHIQFYKR